jgi:mono/diheme cytochrome c family protein
MKNFVTLIVGLSLLLACGSDSTATADRTAKVATLTGNAAAGKTVYETTSSPTCQGCHGADGVGTSASKNVGLQEPSKNDSVSELAGYVLNGIGSMPKQTALSDQQVADLIAYMKQTFGK